MNNQASMVREARNPVLFFANGYGDHFLNLPTIRALSNVFSSRLSVIGKEKVINIFADSIPLRQVVEVEMGRETTGRVFDSDRVAEQVGECDLFISLNPWHNQYVDRLLELLHPDQSLGFFPSFDTSITRDYSKHSADLAFDVAQAVDPHLRIKDFDGPPLFPDKYVNSATRLFATLPDNYNLLAIHPDTLPEKMWSENKWISVIDGFLEEFPGFMVLLVGLGGIDSQKCRHHDRIIPMYGLPIPTTSAIISRCDLFAGVDSCFLHAADMYRIPSIGLFGPTEIHEWGFRFSDGRHLKKGNSMDDLESDDVLLALTEISHERIAEGLELKELCS